MQGKMETSIKTTATRNMKPQSLKDFSSDTSLHGLKNVMDPDKKSFHRVVWLILFTISFSLCMGLLTVTVYNYFNYESVTSYTKRLTSSFNFPSVTICNRESFKTDFYQDELVKEYMSIQIQPSSPYHTNNTFRQWFNQRLQNVSTAEVMAKYGFTLQETVIMCTINRKYIWGCEDYFETISTDVGHCFTFNSKKFIQSNGDMKIKRAGPNAGPWFVLSATENDGYATLAGKGFRVLIHDPSTYPLMTEEAFIVAAGHETDIALSLTVNERLSLPYSDQECVDSDGRYSREYCLLECQTRNLYDSNCSFTSTGSDGCTLYAMLTSWTDLTTVLDDCSSCLPTCKSNVYTHSISSSQITKKTFETYTTAFNWPITNGSVLQQTYAVVNIFFNKMEYTHIVQKEAVSYQTVISDVGGLLGFTLGASILTLSEFAEFIIVMLIQLCSKQKPSTISPKSKNSK